MSLHWTVSLSLMFTAWSVPASVHAEDASSAPPTEFKFEDDLVQGAVPAPGGEILTVRSRGKRESLIRVRENWVVELYKSVEKL